MRSHHFQASMEASSARMQESVIVAVNAAKEVTKHALEWAINNVVQAGDHITLVALMQGGKHAGRRLWSLPRLAGDCANRTNRAGKNRTAEEEMGDLYSNTMHQLHNLCDSKQVKVSLRVVPGAIKGAAAMEAQRVKATWVILDSQLKKDEGKFCLEQLHCNVVIVKKCDAKILRLNLRASDTKGNFGEEASESAQTPSTVIRTIPGAVVRTRHISNDTLTHSSEEAISTSSPEVRTPFTATDKGTSSASSSDPGTSPFTSAEAVKLCDQRSRHCDSVTIDTDSDSEYDAVDAPFGENDSSGDESYEGFLSRCHRIFTAGNVSFEQSSSCIAPPHPWCDYASTNELCSMDSCVPLPKARPASHEATPRLMNLHQQARSSTPVSPHDAVKKYAVGNSRLSFSMREARQDLAPIPSSRLHQNQAQPRHMSSSNMWNQKPTTKELLEKLSSWELDLDYDREPKDRRCMPNAVDFERTSSVRRAMSLSRHVPPGPPPLCSICQHKGPVFGKPPRRFTYAELELATGGFSQANFLAEGGFGSVHRGVLPDGQAVAVKQHKLASSQGDIEFCSEVEVLSCAQHRNVVMLIGYCIEDKRRLLVYEFVCNGSLDSHLYGRDKGCLEWSARQKIAVGAARGLRYLHEECRVGCIVHRDMRPNNILLTHDFEPMVGDFGLARWQPDGDLGVQTRVIGTFGYLAPEYAQSGQITEKADVYSFGVVLLELATGRKAVDLNRPKGQQCLTEWARPLLKDHSTQELIDPVLNGIYSDYEVYCMLHAASLCIRKDPHLRPRMSQVLRILEGDVVIDKSETSTPCFSRKLVYDTNTYGSRSSRMFNEYVVNRALGLGPPNWSNYSGRLEGPNNANGKTSNPNPLSKDTRDPNKISYEALKAAYKDRGNTRRLSYEDIM